ncbi:MAG: asparagine--tRNA ligase [Candidatus Phytoplasma stylosanthis]|uniref:asparagine--tRNA ligase n=1 Tax=Candidatus Phytoplasma stylosanthis TaxID=2798314 RepID=UPI00293A153F|nr:asparagine--tRNA ligase [Candidatus Phytoplasma stylosanthis]MDV3167814.1 asparagine--tRNA ligase [Candidatus Phytoplasma stylosanthis]MDV3170909.1 asparagine--tRNA ligase [Candidatus Phytoplasma stylosanthis]MDV3173587.1 asparagine--tRNA ligase [Candidatus Phytoplasma stylosanthis]MDV3174089.1 asparagine--tRNA ligase [Candidatus Phytoplasma stylosanthis]MDV3202399.1 asparagine--tRNA ligase [Candidatus Phytoplasma stylosanthis]
MMYSVKNLYDNYELLLNKKIFINGWVKNCRFQKKVFFLDLNDGSYIKDLQIVYKNIKNEEINQIKKKLQVGISLCLEGELVLNSLIDQNFEFLAEKIIFLGHNHKDYPIQPKKHSRNFLRQIPHLRLRTKLFGAVFRIRNSASYAIHDFFQKEGFILAHTPIITINDGEGTGELFQVTTLDLNKIPLDENKKIDYKKDFFAKPTFLTVTGQLEGEAMALSFGKIYTFGPTFRAENSNTTKHISEFWMIEPEMAFYNLQDNIKVAQKLIQHVIVFCLEKNKEDFVFLEKNIEQNLIKRLKKVANLEEFKKITYTKAIEILIKNESIFENKPFYGSDLSTEHEKFLTDFFQEPIFIIDWPINIKSFYMKNNPDNKTVAAMDLLVPGIGELIGGSQREENLDILKEKMKKFNISQKELEWYLDLRRFGSCIHSGFGLGLERLLIYLTGLDNIRDVIAFPRTPKNIS